MKDDMIVLLDDRFQNDCKAHSVRQSLRRRVITPMRCESRGIGQIPAVACSADFWIAR